MEAQKALSPKPITNQAKDRWILTTINSSNNTRIMIMHQHHRPNNSSHFRAISQATKITICLIMFQLLSSIRRDNLWSRRKNLTESMTKIRMVLHMIQIDTHLFSLIRQKVHQAAITSHRLKLRLFNNKIRLRPYRIAVPLRSIWLLPNSHLARLTMPKIQTSQAS